MPKKCGHFAGKEVIGAGEMVGKIRAAVDAREDANLQIIARTDAAAVHGIEDAIERGRRFRRRARTSCSSRPPSRWPTSNACRGCSPRRS